MLRYIIIGVAIIAIIPAVGVGWWLLAPLFNEEVVNEPFPTAAAVVATPAAPAPPTLMAPASTATATPGPGPTPTPTPSSGITGEFPLATRAVIPQSVTMAQVETLMAQAATLENTVADAMPAMAADAPADAAPLALLSGQFQDADSFHRGSGTATVYQLGAGGARVLRLDDFRVTNGPDLRVLLADFPNPTERGHLEPPNRYVELARLKGNVGAQNYDIPDDFDLARAGSVVIYCDPFRVIFSTASLAPAAPGS